MRSGLFLLFVAALPAQTTSVPYASESGPLFRIDSVHLQYPQTYRSIKDVDFHNMVLQLDGIRLKDGRYELLDRLHSQFERVELDQAYYIGPLTALVTYYRASTGGSTNSTGLAQVYTLSKHRLAIVQRIVWDEDARDDSQPPDTFDASTSAFLIRSSHYLPGDAHCCISAVDVVRFAWTGTQFEQVSLNVELSEYGKREGKTLPH